MATSVLIHKPNNGNVRNEGKGNVRNKRNLLQHAIIKHKPQRQLEIKAHTNQPSKNK